MLEAISQKAFTGCNVQKKKKKSHEKQHKANWIRHLAIFSKNVCSMCRFPILFLFCSTSVQLLTDNNRQCHVTQSHALDCKRRMAATSAAVLSVLTVESLRISSFGAISGKKVSD